MVLREVKHHTVSMCLIEAFTSMSPSPDSNPATETTALGSFFAGLS